MQGDTAADLIGSVKIDDFTIEIHPSFSEKIVTSLKTGRYEHIERRAARAMLKPGDRVLEIGGAIGVVTLTAASIVGQDAVLSFEANPQLVHYSARNFDNNGFRIETRNAVLKNRQNWTGDAEHVDFYIARDFWASSLTKRGEPIRTVSIPVRCLEQQIAEFGANVLICDIEGGEIDLLEAADLSQINKIIFEVHYWATGAQAINRLLRRLIVSGFAIDLSLTGANVACLYRGARPVRAS